MTNQHADVIGTLTLSFPHSEPFITSRCNALSVQTELAVQRWRTDIVGRDWRVNLKPCRLASTKTSFRAFIIVPGHLVTVGALAQEEVAANSCHFVIGSGKDYVATVSLDPSKLG
jgi:hypothetical protein